MSESYSEMWKVYLKNGFEIYGYHSDITYWDFYDDEDENDVPSSASGVCEEAGAYAFIEFDMDGSVDEIRMQTMDDAGEYHDEYFYNEDVAAVCLS